MENGILKGKGLDIGSEPPRIKICSVPPPPPGMNDNMEHDGYSGYREPSQHEIGLTRHN